MVVSLTGSKTVRPMPERAVALLDARLAPTHAQVSSRDANVRKGFARATNAGKYVLQANPARPNAPLTETCSSAPVTDAEECGFPWA